MMVLRLVMWEISENSPVDAASRGEVRRQAELYKPSFTSFWHKRSYLIRYDAP